VTSQLTHIANDNMSSRLSLTDRQTDIQTWSIPRLHGVGIPAVVGFLGRWHSSIILPCLRYHCYYCLAHSWTLHCSTTGI